MASEVFAFEAVVNGGDKYPQGCKVAMFDQINPSVTRLSRTRFCFEQGRTSDAWVGSWVCMRLCVDADVDETARANAAPRVVDEDGKHHLRAWDKSYVCYSRTFGYKDDDPLGRSPPGPSVASPGPGPCTTADLVNDAQIWIGAGGPEGGWHKENNVQLDYRIGSLHGSQIDYMEARAGPARGGDRPDRLCYADPTELARVLAEGNAFDPITGKPVVEVSVPLPFWYCAGDEQKGIPLVATAYTNCRVTVRLGQFAAARLQSICLTNKMAMMDKPSRRELAALPHQYITADTRRILVKGVRNGEATELGLSPHHTTLIYFRVFRADGSQVFDFRSARIHPRTPVLDALPRSSFELAYASPRRHGLEPVKGWFVYSFRSDERSSVDVSRVALEMELNLLDKDTTPEGCTVELFQEYKNTLIISGGTAKVVHGGERQCMRVTRGETQHNPRITE